MREREWCEQHGKGFVDIKSIADDDLTFRAITLEIATTITIVTD